MERLADSYLRAAGMLGHAGGVYTERQLDWQRQSRGEVGLDELHRELGAEDRGLLDCIAEMGEHDRLRLMLRSELTPRQVDVVEAVMWGRPIADVARRWGCTRTTIYADYRRACERLKPLIKADPDWWLWRLLIEVFGDRVLSLAGY